MPNRSLKRTLITYLAFAFLVSSVLSIVVMLAEYTPSTKKSFEQFGVGGIVLNSILWNLLFTIAGSLSLFNVYTSIKESFLLSLLSFLLLPLLGGIITINLVWPTGDLFGFVEAFICFLIVQTFFFFRFRSCLKKTDSIAVD